MSQRFLPLSLLLLLSQAIPARADLKFRIDNADRQNHHAPDPATRTYAVHPIEPWKPNPLLRARESGKTIDIYRDYVDTGERRWMFGHLARHVIRSERRVPAPGSCSGGEGEQRTKTDGWYIDLPAAPRGLGYLMGGPGCPEGVMDHIEIHTTGPRENGLTLLEVSTSSQGHGSTRSKVVEWDESPLDPKTFQPPANFHQVPSLPNQQRGTFLDNLRYRLAGCVSYAEEPLD